LGTATPLATLNDRELVRACREGSEQAWAQLVDRFSRYVYAISIQAYGLTEHDAEEVFQEVYARTYEHLATLRDDGAIRAWIGQLTRRLAIDRLRVARRERLVDDFFEQVEVRASAELERIELALSIQAAMGGLSDECQEILDRFFARQQSYTEIAEALDIPMGTVASRISRCLSKLRGQLGDVRA
jgi:RNA polymerase sigma-70 factor (ECF subfamily)